MCIYASKIHACIHCSEVWKDSSYPPSTQISQEARGGWNSRYTHWSCISEKYLLPRELKLSKVSMRCSVPSNHCKILLIWGLSLAEDCPGVTLKNALRFLLLFQIQELFLWSAYERPCFERLVDIASNQAKIYKNYKTRSDWLTCSGQMLSSKTFHSI